MDGSNFSYAFSDGDRTEAKRSHGNRSVTVPTRAARQHIVSLPQNEVEVMRNADRFPMWAVIASAVMMLALAPLF